MAEGLSRLFGPALRPVFISDDPGLVGTAGDLGLPACDVGACFGDPPAAAVILCATWSRYQALDQLRAALAGSRVVFVPLVAFDPSPAAARYTLRRLLEADMENALDAHRRWHAVIGRVREPLRFTGPGTDVACALDDEVAVSAVLTPHLAPGDWFSAARFFEVSFEISAGRDTCFRVEGALRARGVLAARGPRFDPASAPDHDEAMAFGRLVAEQGEVDIDVEAGTMVSCRVAGKEWVGTVARLAGTLHRTRLTEFALGVNPGFERFDWGVNSQMNEGAAGVHIGVGDGVSGVHLDFVAPGVAFAGEGS